jgi:predicted MPP superfamily phosphohydrolase
MISHFTLFLTVAMGVLFLAHFFFYFTVIRFFNITGKGYKRTIGGLLIFLSVSFILANFASHWHDDVFTRAFYFFGGFWLGLFLNLLMAAIAAWLIILIAWPMGLKPGRALIGGLFFVLAFAYSIYGVWNAFNPQVRNIQVTIRGLPEKWKGKTIVQLSDVHLGRIYRADFLAKIVARVNALHPDMVAITGDLFDGMDGELSDLTGPLSNLHAPYGVYFITGNHETYLGVDKALAVMKNTGVTVLNDEVRDLDGLQLAGISYPKRGVAKVPGRILKSLAGYVPGKPTVLLYHAPVGINEARDAGVSLQLSGHTHKGQLFPFNFITGYLYKGYDYGLHSLGDYTIYTTDGTGTWGPPMRTGNTPEIAAIKLD